ncbi:MAG: hypothetical protein K0S76_174 [Herbinix sp.]|nr:hypothetical protein [Herbinix sp.]
MKNEEIKLLGVNVKDIVEVMAVAHTRNGRWVDNVRDALIEQSPEFSGYTDADMVAVLYKELSVRYNGRLVEHIQNDLLWMNPDFLGYTDDDFVLVRYEEVKKLSLADYIDRLRVNSTQE